MADGSFCHSHPLHFGKPEGVVDRGGKRVGIARRRQPAGFTGDHRLASAAVIGADDWSAERLGFDQNPAERLGLGRRRDYDVGQHVGRRHVLAAVDGADDATEIEAEDQALELLSVARSSLIVPQNETGEVATPEPGDGLDEHRLALPASQPPGKQDHRQPVGEAPALGEGDDAVGGRLLGAERIDVDAAVDDANARRWHPVDAMDMLADEIGNGDDPLAPGHHRVVPVLEDVSDRVRAMEGGDERTIRASRRPPGAPGRGPRAGMNDVDGLALDELGETMHVGIDNERILAIDWQPDVLGPGAGQAVDQRPAGRRDDGPPAGLDDRRGDVNRSALDPALLAESRQDLKHRGPPLAKAIGERPDLFIRIHGRGIQAGAKIVHAPYAREFIMADVSKPSGPLPLIVTREDGATIAYHRTPGKCPGVVFLTGYKSDMGGAKAVRLEHFCHARGLAYVRFDYFGHGASSGDFLDGTIGRWAGDAVFVLDRLTEGPQILVGSSLGSWIMLLAALSRPERVAALLGIAAAADFTEAIPAMLSAEQKASLERDGVVAVSSPYDPEPTPVTKRILEEGRRHLLLEGEIAINCPVRLIHGMQDTDVPWQTSLRIAERLRSPDVEITLLKSGAHRLSEPDDLERLCETLEALLRRL